MGDVKVSISGNVDEEIPKKWHHSSKTIEVHVPKGPSFVVGLEISRVLNLESDSNC